MAKKIRKAPPKRKSPLLLLVEMLIPWLVMGAAATILFSMGISEIPTVVLALGAALGTTVLIRYYEKRRAVPEGVHESGSRRR